MFKPSNQTRAKSPYQPKLLQALIDSSDDEKLSMSSGENCSRDMDQEENYFEYKEEKKSRFSDPYGVEDKRSVRSVYTSLSQQTVKAKQSTDFNLTKYVKHQKEVTSQLSNLSKPQTLNLTRFAQKNQPKPSSAQQNSFNSLSQKPKASQSPAMTIKYDTLKLSQYNSQEMKKQEQLYQQNIKDFREKFNSSKPQKSKAKKEQILIEQENQELDDDYMDSLEAMKKSNLNRRHFSRKSLKNQHSTPSSRIKFLQQQKEQNSNEKGENFHQNQFNNSSETEILRKELKRSKDIIKTLTLKNSDLQKALEMKGTKLMEFESEQNSRMTEIRNKKEKQCAQQNAYQKINLYMKERVKNFMNEVKTIKMSPLLEQNIESFLEQILQLNQVTVNQKLGITETQQEERQPFKEISQKLTPNRLSKSIFHTKSEIGQKDEPRDNAFSSTSNQFRNRFQTSYPQSHISIGTNRQNAFISAKNDLQSASNIKGITVKADLSSNKENITPNKKLCADEEFKQLEKSLQKLKAMEKQLSTPAPKNQFVTNKSHLVSNNEDYRTEYSIINRSHFSVLGKEENNSMNLSSNNLDRSKSRRKKIFADTNQK